MASPRSARLTTTLNATDRVAVVGGGTMGAGIAQVALTAGHPVRLHDLDADRAERAVAQIHERLDQRVRKGKMSAEARTAVLGRLEVAKRLDDLDGARLVVEAVAESLEIKREIFRR